MPLADQQRICDLCVSKTASEGVPAVIRCSAQHHRSHSQTPARFFLTVALILTIAQFIVGLQMSTLPEWLTIEGAEHVTLVVAGCGVIAGCEICRVLSGLILDTMQENLIIGCVAILVIAYRAFYT